MNSSAATHASPPSRRAQWPGWSHLPRDARDTLFLLAVIGWTSLPHLLHLPAWCAVLTVGVLLWRARLAVAGSALPGRSVLVVVLVVAAGLTYWSFGSLLGKEPGVTMAVALMALKTLELRARRDAFVVFFLGFFLILTHFLYSQGLGVAAMMLLSIWGLLTALVLAHMPAGAPSLRTAAVLAGKTAALGTPLMVLLFVLFPRVGPLWGVPQDGFAGTGLSNSMSMGTVAALAQDDSVALRIRFEGPPPQPQDTYFRGPVLSHFDGREWTPLKPSFPEAMTPRAELRVQGTPIYYEMTLEPTKLVVAPLLEASPQAPQVENLRFTQTDDLQWVSERPLFERLRFRGAAYPEFQHGPLQPMIGLQDYLDLPPGYNPRTLAWAVSLRQQRAYAQADGATLAGVLMERIRSGGYGYTLTPGLYGEADPRTAIDEFWLDRKLGFCEHYAAAFVVLMRALDVPARVVTGYQGLDPTPVDGYRIVRQSYAHAWAEYWQPGVGWVRADPTAAVAPDRVLRSRQLTTQPGLVAGALDNFNPQLLATLRNGWEALNNRWNQWVLSYSRGSQFDLLRKLGFDAPSWEDLALLLAGAFGVLSLAAVGWAWWGRHHIDPWTRQMQRLRAALQRLGINAAGHEAPRTLAQRVRARFGVQGESLATLLERLDAQRYGPRAAARPDPALTRHFQAQAKRLARAAQVLSAALIVVAASPDDAAAVNAMPAPASPTAATTASSTTATKAPTAQPIKQVKRRAHPARKATVRSDSDPDIVTYGRRDDLMAFGAEVAARHALDTQAVQATLAQARFVPSIVKAVMPPPAGTAKNWAAYRARFVEPKRIAAGVAFWQAHEAWLTLAEERYGVPPEIVVGIVGVETLYGQHMGNHKVIDALTTLGFDFPTGRKDRSEFFRAELEQLLVLSHREGRDPLTLMGSYAGALGMPQFMPSSVNKYAVDFDGDGHIDLHANTADVIGSVAHYLAEFGWQRGLPTHYEVAVPSDASERALLLGPDILPTFTAQQFIDHGAAFGTPAPPLTDSNGSDAIAKLALVELQNGPNAPSYVAGTTNFYAVTRYNWSSYYAMAVIDLGQAVGLAVKQAR